MRRLVPVAAALVLLGAPAADAALPQPPAAAAGPPIAALPSAASRAIVAVSAAGRVAWRVTLGERPASVSMEGELVVATLTDGLLALDARTGEFAWRLPLQGRPTAPTAHAGLLLVGTSSGRLVAVDPATGVQRWNADVGGPVAAPPQPAGDLLVVGTKRREVVALAAADGTARWRAQMPSRVTAPTAVLPGVVYVAAWDGRLAALDPGSGTARWSVPLGGPIESALVAQRVDDRRDAVTALTEDGTIVTVLAPAPGAPADLEPRVTWTHRQGADDPAPAAAGGRLFLAGRDVVALDAADGRVLWRLTESLARGFGRELTRLLVDRERGLSPEEVRAARATSPYELRGAPARAPAVAAGLLLTTTDEGFIYALDPATGTLRWRLAEGD